MDLHTRIHTHTLTHTIQEKARGGSKAKKAPKASAKPEKVQKAHVTGGHNREFRMPKKKKEKPMGRKKGGKSAANDSD